MKQEDKQLLLVDLCARLPYEVKVQYNNEIYNIDYISALYEEVKLDIPNNYTIGISEIKPYLRSCKDMTEDEKNELLEVLNEESNIVINNLKTNNCGILEGKYHFNSLLQLRWCLKKHFDIIDLIPKGLAIQVTDENNPYEKDNN